MCRYVPDLQLGRGLGLDGPVKIFVSAYRQTDH